MNVGGRLRLYYRETLGRKGNPLVEYEGNTWRWRVVEKMMGCRPSGKVSTA
jgi:hypothetical protein